MTARPVAVLADDAASAGQVRGLLPGTGQVVATSRHELTSLIALDDARFIRLGSLDAPATAELTARIIGRPGPDPTALAELARSCGHLPPASDHSDTALDTFTRLGERYHQTRTLYGIATAHLAAGNLRQAITLLDEARPLIHAEDHPLSLAGTLTALAQARALHAHLHLPGNHPARAQTTALAGQLTAQTALQPPNGTPSQPGAPGPQHPGTPDA